MAYFGHCNATTGALLADPPGGFESGDANYAFALKKADEIVCPGTGPQSVTSLAAYFKYATTHAHIRIALYTTATPRVLVCQHAAEVEVTSLTGSWVGGAQSLTWHNSYTTLTGGTSYIIVFSQDDNTVYPAYDTGTSGDSDYASGDYTGGFPDTLNAGSAWGLKYCLAVQVEPVATGPFTLSSPDAQTAAILVESAAVASAVTESAAVAMVVAESVGWAAYQNARPDADVADGGWLNEAASNTNLHLSVGEGIPNLATYIRSSTDPVNDTCTFGLTDIANPADGEILIRVIARWVE